MKRFLWVAPIMLVSSTLMAGPECWKHDPTVGGWSCEAVSLRAPGIGRAVDEDKRDIAVTSPDGLKKVRVRGIQLSLEMHGKEISFPREIPEEDLIVWPSELSWSPDSKWIFITESGGSNLGGWHVRLFQIQGESVQRGPGVTE